MIISHQPYILPAFVDGSFKPMGTDRAPGMHLSRIVRKMMESMGTKNLEGIPGEQEWMRAQIGFLWEAAIEWAWKEYQGITRPVDRSLKLELDRIHMTPDGLNHEDGMLEEYKFTWKSMRKWEEAPEEEFWHWMVQTKGYLKGINETFNSEMYKVRFIVFWAGGSYQWKPGRGPQPTETIIEWTPQEIEDNWKTIIRYRDFMEKEESNGTRENG